MGLGGQEMDQLEGPLHVDTSVGGFRVKRLLGEGAMGEVYLAQDLTLGRRVALKVIKRGVMQGDGLSQFLDEARRTASFSHPHIVTIHAFGDHDGRPFLALEYLDGETLRDRIRTAPLSSLAAMRVVRAVADAVAEAHRHDLVHADLKPENIFLPRDGRVRVLDFGLARTVGASIGASGTPAYMAPERWRGTPMTGAADVWALGLPSLCTRFHLESSDWPHYNGLPIGSASWDMGEQTDNLYALRPRIDQLDMAHTRARAEQLLFGSAVSAKVGRYLLLGKTGNGGMGVVYAAYDPELHRKVALKILHPQYQHERARERLIGEARALARLDHPNIVKVHDVLTHGDLVVLVMEWVEGETLAAWQCAATRSWRDALPVYVQAAQGLAAAHSVGVIHRDFKPANAIVGADGRVRVLDFGLARPAQDAHDDDLAADQRHGIAGGSGRLPGPVGETWPSGLTATGALVGTLGYAPPEQL